MAIADSSSLRVFLSAALCLVASCGGGEEPKPAPGAGSEALVENEAGEISKPAASGALADGSQSPAEMGAQVFAAACALCHGATGDGNGLAKFDKPARSFVDGGFSFGNTPEALYRTVSSGIGGTPMPGFKDSLTEQERRAVVDHVISLGPERVAVVPGATVMTVTDKPLVVRGSFPPLREGDEMTPRGLLVGGLDGLSFQYDREDMRLLAVRQGEFVDRRDWENRGGDTLEPLGEVVFTMDDVFGELGWTILNWDVEPSSEEAALSVARAEFAATQIRTDSAIVEYDLYHGAERVATVQEHVEALSLGGWTGFRRTFDAWAVGEADIHVALFADGSFSDLPDLSSSGRDAQIMEDERGFGTVWMTQGTLNGFVAAPTSDTVPVRWTHDVLYGLKPTEANLAALKEAL
ncbi:MAG: mono/diheme cytochrome c family protein [Bacteroidia bacterium]|jgi:mono/diheme cytochrome c family protein